MIKKISLFILIGVFLITNVGFTKGGGCSSGGHSSFHVSSRSSTSSVSHVAPKVNVTKSSTPAHVPPKINAGKSTIPSHVVPKINYTSRSNIPIGRPTVHYYSTPVYHYGSVYYNNYSYSWWEWYYWYLIFHRNDQQVVQQNDKDQKTRGY